MVLNTRTHRDAVKLLTDHDGRVHAVIAVSQSRKIVDLVIGQHGVEERQVVRENVAPDDIDAAFDKQGRLHIVSHTEHLLHPESEHLVQLDARWVTSGDTPWQAAGIRPYAVHFVPGWPDLLWVFSLNGNYVGAPGGWGLIGFGGYGGGFIFPFYGHGTKIVVAPNPFTQSTDRAGAKVGENDRADWCEVDPTTADSALFSRAASDGRHIIYLLYVTTGIGGVMLNFKESPANKTVWFIRKQIGSPAAELLANDSGRPASTEATAAAPCVLSGAPVTRLSSELYFELAFAVDRDTGTALALAANSGGAIYANDDWATTVPPPLDQYTWPHVVPAGNGRFHVLVVQQEAGWWSVKLTISYLMRTKTAWSRAIRLGNPKVATWNGSELQAIDMVDAPGGKAFMVWPVPEGIVGQWVEPDTHVESTHSMREQSNISE